MPLPGRATGAAVGAAHPGRHGYTQRYWYSLDGRGNVVALTDASGQVVDRYHYDVWGVPTIDLERVPQPLLYAGYVYDREFHGPGEASGWYWLSVRHYDPALGRFLQPDPSEQEGVRSYAYAGDDPLDATDPSGLCVAGVFGTDCKPSAGWVTTTVGIGLTVVGAAIDVVSLVPSVVGAVPLTVAGEVVGTSLLDAGLTLQAIGLGTNTAANAVQAYMSVDSGANNDLQGSDQQQTSPIDSAKIRGPYGDVTAKNIKRIKVEPGRDFSPAQKRILLNANREANGGQIVSDNANDPHALLVPSVKSMEGITPAQNEVQVDHIYPRSQGGSNGFGNAEIVSREYNRQKSDALPVSGDLPESYLLP